MLRKTIAGISIATSLMIAVILGAHPATASDTFTPASAGAEVPVAEPEIPTELADIDPNSGAYISEATLAATGCGATCDYKNPNSFKIYHSGCSTCYHYCEDDAYTRYAVDEDSIGYIELRYSPRCRTAWARTDFVDVYISVHSRYLNGNHRATASSWTNSSIRYSPMLNDANLQARACMPAHGPWEGNVCTGWW